MTSILDYAGEHAVGIVVLLLAVATACGTLQWILWLFGLGRFRDVSPREANTRYILTQLFVKIITDFRHFLALVIVVVFAIALFMAISPGLLSGNVADIAEGVQIVAAGLGGLIGSIIGYYFGESAARRDAATTLETGPDVQEVQQGLGEIRPAGKPKGLEGKE